MMMMMMMMMIIGAQAHEDITITTTTSMSQLRWPQPIGLIELARATQSSLDIALPFIIIVFFLFSKKGKEGGDGENKQVLLRCCR